MLRYHRVCPVDDVDPIDFQKDKADAAITFLDEGYNQLTLSNWTSVETDTSSILCTDSKLHFLIIISVVILVTQSQS